MTIKMPADYWSWLNPQIYKERVEGGERIRQYHSYLRVRYCRNLRRLNPNMSFNDIIQIFYRALENNLVVDGLEHKRLSDVKNEDGTYIEGF